MKNLLMILIILQYVRSILIKMKRLIVVIKLLHLMNVKRVKALYIKRV